MYNKTYKTLQIYRNTKASISRTYTRIATDATSIQRTYRHEMELQIGHAAAVHEPLGQRGGLVGDVRRGMEGPAGAVADHHYIGGGREHRYRGLCNV